MSQDLINTLAQISKAITNAGRVSGRVNKARFAAGTVTKTSKKGGQFALSAGDVVSDADAKTAALYLAIEKVDKLLSKEFAVPSLIVALRDAAKEATPEPAAETAAE